jgi:L-ascorbate metabolism protein UlaG (beta-lactamase superfamily)
MRSRVLMAPVFALLLVACPKSSDSSGGAPAATTASAPTSAPPSGAAVTPDAASPRSERAADVIKTSLGDLRIVPIHHGTVLFELAGKEYYVDPFHEGGKLEGLPPADVIFITHAHPDHLDPAAIGSLRKPSTIIVCPPSVAEKLPVDPQAGGRDSSGIVVMKNGDKQSVAGVGVEAVAMYNLKRGPAPGKLFHEKGWGEGFVLTFGDKRVYLSGDTECTPEMRALKDIDVAFVCMNLPYTMPPAEAAECVEAFKPKVLYPYHYRGSDLSELDKALAADKQIEVRKRDWY